MIEEIELIRAHNKAAVYAMTQQQRMDRALGAYIVFNVLKMPYDANAKTRKALWTEAGKLISGAKPTMSSDHFSFAPLIASLVETNSAARKPYDAMRKSHEKELIKLARQLPVWPHFKTIMKTGELSLARIVAEAGDLNNYATVSKLWKRMGLAVLGGSRQGNPGKGASAEIWIEHGYNPQRRAVMWVIGNSMIRNNKIYRPVYLAAKTAERARADDNKPKSLMHAHKRAQRKMEKQFLADLWSAWTGRAIIDVEPRRNRPALPIQPQMEAVSA